MDCCGRISGRGSAHAFRSHWIDLRVPPTPVLAIVMRLKTRKLILILHITSAVGWLGAIAAFLALALAGRSSHEDRLVSSAYVAMSLVGWRVVVPLGLASLLTGLVQSLGSAWGLFRHYWVLLKFVMTVIATGLLLLRINLATHLSEIASGARLPPTHWHGMRLSIVADSAAAIALLTVNVTLSVFKPKGLTPYGQRKHRPMEYNLIRTWSTFLNA